MSKYENILSVAVLSVILSACGGSDTASDKNGSNLVTNPQQATDNGSNVAKVLHKASGRYFSADTAGILRVWSEDQKSVLDEINVSSSALSSLSISPDSKKIIVGDRNGVIHYYRIDNGSIINESYKSFSAENSGGVQKLSFDLLSYNFFSVTEDGQRRVWDKHVSSPIKEMANGEGETTLPIIPAPELPM